MSISMYQASVPRFVNILGNLSNILDKAQAHCDAKKLDPATLTGFRLFPDMLPMAKQVQIACDMPRAWWRDWPGWRSRCTRTTRRHWPS